MQPKGTDRIYLFMIIRLFLSACLLVASSMTGAQALDRAMTSAGRADACDKVERVRADRCMPTAPETIVYGSVSDHGPDYDAQGNPVDRRGDIIAVPAGRAASGQLREVFVSESRQ
jgi:hypothetical protein